MLPRTESFLRGTFLPWAPSRRQVSRRRHYRPVLEQFEPRVMPHHHSLWSHLKHAVVSAFHDTEKAVEHVAVEVTHVVKSVRKK